jgi:peptidoglycan/LPS O-acetylase OafA/YrhL
LDSVKEDMALSIYDYVYGIAQMAAGFLAIFAGILALTLFKTAKKQLRAWRYLLIALVIFVILEIVGALAAFGVPIAPYWTHVLVSVLLLFVIAALITQIHVNKGWTE